MWYSRDHNATSYSTETTSQHDQTPSISAAEIITLRAIALKPRRQRGRPNTYAAEIITLRAIALKLHASWLDVFARCCRDHNATSYSTETSVWTSSRVKAVSRDHNATSYSTETRRVGALIVSASGAEIITLRAIALKLEGIRDNTKSREVSRDHNATSYSTETFWITTSASRIALQRS